MREINTDRARAGKKSGFGHRYLDMARPSQHNRPMKNGYNTPHPIATTGSTYVVQAYAKINLTLDVLGRRADGYHDLATVMQTIDLYDTISLTTTADKQLRLFCSQTELNTDDNLALRAAQALLHYCGIEQGLDIELHKRIPVAAGLGGGSSDAATVLLALQTWWQLALSADEMLSLAAELGSDVPFFLTGGLALCEGRGERVTQLPLHWPAALRWLLLLKPAIGVSTATVFRNLPPDDYTDGSHSRAVTTALRNRQAVESADLHNGLERSVLERYPRVAQARADLLHAGATLVRLSGSGPTLFAPFAGLTQAALVEQRLREQGYEVYLTRPIYSDNVHAYVFS